MILDFRDLSGSGCGPNLNDAKETISEEHLKAIVDIFDRIEI